MNPDRMNKPPRGGKDAMEVDVNGATDIFGYPMRLLEGKDADFTASSSDGRMDRPASRYVSSRTLASLGEEGT